MLYYCNTVGGPGGIEAWSLGPSFSTLTLLVGSFDPQNPVPDMTYNVFGGTLNLPQPRNQVFVQKASLIGLTVSIHTTSVTDRQNCHSICRVSCNVSHGKASLVDCIMTLCCGGSKYIVFQKKPPNSSNNFVKSWVYSAVSYTHLTLPTKRIV